MLAGLPAVATGGALFAYGIGKKFNPKLELSIVSMFTGKKKIIANIVRNFGAYIKAAAQVTGVPWQYIVGIIYNETKGIQYPVKDSLHPEPWVTIEPRHKTEWPAGTDYHKYSSYGPMQVSFVTAGKYKKWVTDWRELLDFNKNIQCGAMVLRDNYAIYKNWDKTVMSYNGTPGIPATVAYLNNVASAVISLNEMVAKGEVYYA